MTSSARTSSLEPDLPLPFPVVVPEPLEDDWEDPAAERRNEFLPEFQPFPVECLPTVIGKFVTAKAAALNADPATLALFTLSALAGAIGNCRLKLKESWSEPAILWTAVIADGQTCHDAALDAVTEWHGSLDSQQTGQQWTRYLDQEQRYCGRHNFFGDGPLTRERLQTLPTPQAVEDLVRPTKPVPVRSVTRDWSVPALARLLKGQPGGMLLASVELDGWLGKSLGNSSRAARERQIWFDLQAGRNVTVETRSSRPADEICQPALSVTGVLSDGVLSKKLIRKEGPCGLASRLLFASPPVRPSRWTDNDVEEQTETEYRECLKQLRGIADQSEEVVLSGAARRLFVAFMNEVGRRQPLVDEALSTWHSLLPRQVARLALVLHLARSVSGETTDPETCDETSLQAAITLAEWFTNEAQRVVQRLSFDTTRRDQQQVLEWVARHECGATPRELCRSNRRKYPTVEVATQAMEQLSQAQMAVWATCDPGPQGGRPTRRLVSFYGIPEEQPVSPPPPAVTTSDAASATPAENLTEVSSGAPPIRRTTQTRKTAEREQKVAKEERREVEET